MTIDHEDISLTLEEMKLLRDLVGEILSRYKAGPASATTQAEREYAEIYEKLDAAIAAIEDDIAMALILAEPEMEQEQQPAQEQAQAQDHQQDHQEG